MIALEAGLQVEPIGGSEVSFSRVPFTKIIFLEAKQLDTSTDCRFERDQSYSLYYQTDPWMFLADS